MIERIKEFAAELRMNLLLQLETPQDGKVFIDHTRAAQNPHSVIAKLKLRGLGKGCGVGSTRPVCAALQAVNKSPQSRVQAT